MLDDTLIYYGGACKSLGDGRIGGHLVIFTDAGSPDLTGDFFTAKTDFDFEDGERRSGYYDHGLDLTVKNRKIGRGALTRDDVGVWLEAQLDTADEYAAAILQLVEKGALGFSSGAVSHLVRREPEGKASHLTHWPIGEWSITPTPAEPRTKAVALKSLTSTPLASLVAGEPPAEQSEAAEPRQDDETKAAAGEAAQPQILFRDGRPASDLSLTEHSDTTASVFKELRDHVGRRAEVRIKAGRRFSAESTSHIRHNTEQIIGYCNDLLALLDDMAPSEKSAPPVDDLKARALRGQSLRVASRSVLVRSR